MEPLRRETAGRKATRREDVSFRSSEEERERSTEAARRGGGGEVAIYASDTGEPGLEFQRGNANGRG